jgi:hypothetical protein
MTHGRAKRGTTPTNFGTQVAFIWYELTGKANAAEGFSSGADPYYLTGLKATQSVEIATRIFMTDFEQPNKKHEHWCWRFWSATVMYDDWKKTKR